MRQIPLGLTVLGVSVLLVLATGCAGRVEGDPRKVVGEPTSEPEVIVKAPAPAPDPGKPKEEWGTIKGKAVWGGGALPKPVALVIPAGAPACIKGPLFSEEYVIDPKTKGVKNVFVWLADADVPKKGQKWAPLPVHPSLAKSNNTEVVLDQPCCTFEPHALAMRDDQTLKIKNSAAFNHNIHLTGRNDYGLNKLIPAGGFVNEQPPANAELINVQCDIHTWMKGYIHIFDHPYYALTGEDGTFEIKNAPAGKYRLFVWHEGMGWVVFDDPERPKDGKVITIKANEPTDVGELKVMPGD